MTRPLPIACTLSPTDLRAREAELRALGGDGLVSSDLEAGRAVLRFRPDAGIRERVERLVAAESECCAFLDFRLEHGEDATVLTIAAPDGGAEAVELFASALGSPGPAQP